ncbi:cytochrome c biogenesis protein CcdA [Acetobacterium wieringae]|uniref:Cytochrome c biogenesis protein CcdA n=1 Tax=Acetobacterium wieringae TaxID=52694 RepID=A0ABY6HDA4_9FIRM|nr:cytochrome c biogenesis protein CcdA [Acetobacterium wieringae]MEA4805656.1 cytochrome c biogenesis protein CcdA [Acetobacterium wieringae]UYO62495.1 cytochrome c biogenesis protein CcdA [Acetobacterium wieringae]VUZ25412.1 Protein DipZ [Acetobacterium wieringae]
MDYFIAFLEGIITFISPCLLPMLPIYISYFAGQTPGDTKRAVIINALGFVLGFTVIFVLLGAFAGKLGSILIEYSTVINVAGGIIIILFGLNFMDLLNIPFLNTNRQMNLNHSHPGFFSALLFGIVFSIGWTPCVGAFLGSALMMAASSGDTLHGILMLFSFSLGLGIPFMVSAILIDRMKSTFDFIKRHYEVINRISGGLLVVIGLLMATGLLGTFLSLLTF